VGVPPPSGVVSTTLLGAAGLAGLGAFLWTRMRMAGDGSVVAALTFSRLLKHDGRVLAAQGLDRHLFEK